jgi:RHS repeat-associated protein
VIAEPGALVLSNGMAVLSWLDDGGPIPVTVTVTPAQAKAPGQMATVIANVKDQDGSPMIGRVVTFDRRGVNPGTTTATTDLLGNATLTYTGTGGGGADVIAASTPSIGGAAVSGVGTVIWTEAPAASGTAVAFVPAAAHAPSGSATLPFRATKADGSPFAGTVRYAVGPLGSPGPFSRSTTTDAQGLGAVPVTTSASEVEVLAYADQSSVGAFGTQDTTEAAGIAVLTTRAVPRGTAVAFNPPVVTGQAGTQMQLPFKGTYTDGSPFRGTVRWCVAPASATTCTTNGTSTTSSDGTGYLYVTPTAANPTLRVTAYADAFTSGTQDPTEATGAAVASGTAPPPVTTTTTVPPVTTTTIPPPPVTTTTIPPPPVTTTIPPPPVTTTTIPPPPVTVPPVTTTIPPPPVTIPPVTIPPLLSNQPPRAPSQVSPSAGHAFSTTDAQMFVINAVDPDGDAYTGTVEARNTSTGSVTSFATSASVSGTDSEGAPTTPLAQGSYTWRARATDDQGANGSWSESRPFSVANQAPIVPTLLAPAPAKAFSTDDPQLFSVVSNDAEGDPYTATISIRNTATGATTSFTTGPAQSGRNAEGSPAPPLPVGDYTWTARATDVKGANGPTSGTRALSVIVNRRPGIPTQVAPAANKVMYQADSQVFTLAAEDPNGDAYTGTVTVRDVNGIVVDTFATSPALSGEYSSGVPTKVLAAGAYTWSATAKDDPTLPAGPASPQREFRVSSKSDIPPVALPGDIPTTRASVGAAKIEADDESLHPDLSADGRYIAFESEATNLVLDDMNGRKDIFVHDRLTTTTERVSVSDSEAPASASGFFESFDPAISADGRYVAFISSATNLVSGDTNGRQDVFVRDREAGTTVRVNLSSSGAQANGSTYEIDLSGDGRHVAFASDATNLVSGDTNLSNDVFVRDIDTNTTQRLSTVFTSKAQSAGGTLGARNPSISHNGRQVAFESDAIDLMGSGLTTLDSYENGGNSTVTDVFLHDRDRSWGTVLVSNDATFTAPNGYSNNAKVLNGRYVLFDSTASDLLDVTGDTNGVRDVFLWDDSMTTTTRVSLNSSEAQANGPSFEGSLSPDGNYVAFRSSATNLVAGDRNGEDDIFLRDLAGDTTTLVSHDADGHQANNENATPSVSSDAMHVAFSSRASNLVAADTNLTVDVFGYNRRLSLTCAAGALSTVGCLSGYGFKASSDRIGLEDFYGYHAFGLGSETAYLNVSNGNLVVQGTDLDVPGQGLNMRLVHTYNSQKDQGEGPLGRGWRLGVADGNSQDLLGAVVSAVMSADVGQILEVIVTEDQFDYFDADGTRHHFIKGGLDGPGWHAPPGVDLTLVDYLVGTERRYKATRPDGVTYEFRPTGAGGGYYLDRIADRKGNQLGFFYSASRLSSITDANGRSISFTWSGDYLASATYGANTVSYAVDAASGRLQSITAGGRTVSYGYNGSGLASATDGRGKTTSFTLADGMLTQLVDRAGKGWNVAYNTTGCQPGDSGAAVATCITDPGTGGGTQVYTSSAEGNLISYRDAGDTAPNQRSYLWDANRVMSETDEAGDTNEYTYNANGQVVLNRQSGSGDPPLTTLLTYRDVSPGVADLVESRVGVDSNDERVTRFGRAEDGTLTSTTDPEGAVTRFTYLSGGRLASVTDPRGKTTTYGSYHASGQPGTITDATAKTTTYTYDSFGRVTSVLDRNGQTWGAVYDARGNVTSRSTPVGTATFGYDGNDNQTTATPPGGATVTRAYDNRDLLTESSATIDGVLRKVTYSYFDDGQLRYVNGPRNFAGSPTVTQRVEYRRYPNNRVSAVVDESGFLAELTYTPDGLVRTSTEPAGTTGRNVTTHTYNRNDQVTSVMETGHSNPTTTAYSLHGELLSTRTPKGATDTYVYDKVGRLLRSVDAQGRQSTRTYDAAGNLVSATQPEGQGGQLTTTYSYTDRNEIASESDPADGSHSVSYTYDNEGRQLLRQDRFDGVVQRTVEQTYRSDGAMLTRTATGTGLPTHASTYGYDTAGNLTSATATLNGATVSSSTFGYNEGFAPTTWSETVHDTAGVARTKSGSYAYQPDGLLGSRTVDGLATGYQHSVNGRETRVSPWSGNSFVNEYHDNGLLRKTTLPNNVVVDQLFDPADRLASRIVRKQDTTQTQLSAWTGIAYDDDDQRTQETVTQAQPTGEPVPVRAGTGTYAYDSQGRLVSAKHPFEPNTAAYTLDDGGNIVKDAESVYTYVKNRLTRRAGTEVEQHPDGGTTTTAESSTYEYDRLGNQSRDVSTRTTTSRLEGQTGTRTDDLTRTYTYDAASQPDRVASQDGSWVGYSYDALGRMVRRVEHPVSGADMVTLFFHDGPGEGLVLETDGAGTVQTRYVLDSQGEPLAQDKNGSRSYYVDDPRGNLTQQLDNSQNVVAVYAYDPYGKEKKSLTRTTGTNWDSRLRFQMAPRDRTTGAYNLGQRLLDPKINRFVGADSYVGAAANMDLALDPLTGNRYLYAGANPAGLVDNGHAPKWMKQAARWGKGILRNRVIRSIVITGGVLLICGTGILCGFVVGGVIGGAWGGANYAANAKNKSVGGFLGAVGRGAASGAAEGAAAAALAKAQAAIAARQAAVAKTVAARAAFHHTTDAAVGKIMSEGLRAGAYATPIKGLSPLQAHIELALNPAGGARNAILKINLEGLRAAGYEIPQMTRVRGAFGMPGGGWEMRFPYEIPSEFLKVVS